MQKLPISRRALFGIAGAGLASTVLPHQVATAADEAARNPSEDGSSPNQLRFGLIADVHQDVVHDGVERVAAFVDAMTEERVDFVMQLGDFCRPYPRNTPFMQAWRQFEGERFHVIGNHDTDGGFSREQVVEYFGMPARYYSFVRKGVRFIVLDGNDPGGQPGGYPCFIAEDQAAWLQETLAEAEEPIVITIHQPLDSSDGPENRAAIRELLEAKNRDDSPGRVLAVIAGHSHTDFCQCLNGIHYIMVNSSSYQWVGGKYKHQSYAPEIHEAAPWLDHTCPYAEPIWAVCSIDLDRGAIEMEGKETQWVGPNPVDCGVDLDECLAWSPKYSQPRISDWRLPLTEPGDLTLY